MKYSILILLLLICANAATPKKESSQRHPAAAGECAAQLKEACGDADLLLLKTQGLLKVVNEHQWFHRDYQQVAGAAKETAQGQAAADEATAKLKETLAQARGNGPERSDCDGDALAQSNTANWNELDRIASLTESTRFIEPMQLNLVSQIDVLKTDILNSKIQNHCQK